MAKTQDAYSQLCAEIKSKVKENSRAKGKPSASVSKSDLDNMALTFLNTPDHVVTNYIFSSKDTNGADGPVGVEKKPAMRYRQALKSLVQKNFNVDKHDAESMETIPFNKEHASSMIDLSLNILKDYMDVGRKVAFPITEKDECRMEIMTTRAPERTSSGNRFKPDQNPDDAPVTVTAERTIIKAKNPTPSWLKKQKNK